MFSTISMFLFSLRSTRWLLTEEPVQIAELVTARIVPVAGAKLPRLEVDDETILVAAVVVRHAGAAAAGPGGEAPAAAVRPAPRAAAQLQVLWSRDPLSTNHSSPAHRPSPRVHPDWSTGSH